MNAERRHSLIIRELRLEAFLGCSKEERSVPQEVRVSVEFRFFKAPEAVISDDLKDTICYAQVGSALRECLSGREYCLVEKMAEDFYRIVRSMVKERAEISLCVHKIRPPVDDLLGGVEYRVEGFV